MCKPSQGFYKLTDLSPAAQAVLAAIKSQDVFPSDVAVAAAALRVAADQVMPKALEPPCGEHEPWPRDYQLMRDAQWEKCQQLRSEFFAIAAELEVQR